MHVVTGAFGYSGRYITSRLLAAGKDVRTLTNSPERANPFGNQVAAFPFNFDNPGRLAAALDGAEVLYNTYWVRFNHRSFGFSTAVQNTLAMLKAARMAGVRRIVHVSITNADEMSHLEYFRGKGQIERAVIESGLSYAILRPTVLFGREDILINNIAWALRRLPIFGVFGDGSYRLQPIYVDDFAELAVKQGDSRENVVVDAIGPTTFTYRELVATISRVLGVRRPILSVSPSLGYAAGWLIGKLVGDVFVTRDEIAGLMNNLLYTESPPAGQTKLVDWVREHADTLGRSYASELGRRRNLVKAYDSL